MLLEEDILEDLIVDDDDDDSWENESVKTIGLDEISKFRDDPFASAGRDGSDDDQDQDDGDGKGQTQFFASHKSPAEEVDQSSAASRDVRDMPEMVSQRSDGQSQQDKYFCDNDIQTQRIKIDTGATSIISPPSGSQQTSRRKRKRANKHHPYKSVNALDRSHQRSNRASHSGGSGDCYVLAQTDNFENIMISQQHGVWFINSYQIGLSVAEKLSRLYLQQKKRGCELYLLFTVEGSDHYQGYARMISDVGEVGYDQWIISSRNSSAQQIQHQRDNATSTSSSTLSNGHEYANNTDINYMILSFEVEWIGKVEVTYKQAQQLMPKRPYSSNGAQIKPLFSHSNFEILPYDTARNLCQFMKLKAQQSLTKNESGQQLLSRKRRADSDEQLVDSSSNHHHHHSGSRVKKQKFEVKKSIPLPSLGWNGVNSLNDNTKHVHSRTDIWNAPPPPLHPSQMTSETADAAVKSVDSSTLDLSTSGNQANVYRRAQTSWQQLQRETAPSPSAVKKDHTTGNIKPMSDEDILRLFEM
ncbi:hypothetical protein MP228_011635 [Amoeboaphelidium protococcarum]|nr:hypothetical protein MP228_011635 [Amoeboaphelidium protococcarum]